MNSLLLRSTRGSRLSGKAVLAKVLMAGSSAAGLFHELKDEKRRWTPSLLLEIFGYWLTALYDTGSEKGRGPRLTSDWSRQVLRARRSIAYR